MVDAFAHINCDITQQFSHLHVIDLHPHVLRREIISILNRENFGNNQFTSEVIEVFDEKFQKALDIVRKRKGVVLLPSYLALILSLVEDAMKDLDSNLSNENLEIITNVLSSNSLAEITDSMMDILCGVLGLRSLLSSPLHLSIVAETFAEDVTKALDCDGKLLEDGINILVLFRRFLGLKRKHFRAKHGLNDSNYENTNLSVGEEDIFRELHQSYAMLFWSAGFTENYKSAFLNIAEKYKKYLSKEKNGILWQLENGETVFAHFVLMEYFVAWWLFDNRKQKRAYRLIQLAFRSRTANTVKLFLDWMLCEGQPLHEAVLEDDLGALEAALAAGERVDSLDAGGRSALHLAATHERREAVHKLVDAGCGVGLPDTLLQWSPLQYADASLALEAAERLLEAGADAAQLNNIVSVAATSAEVSFRAAALDLSKVIGRLLQSAARRNVMKGYCVNTTQHSATLQNDQEENDGRSTKRIGYVAPIHMAVLNNSTKVSKALLESGVDVNLLCDQYTPLRLAVEYGHSDMVQLLLSYKADTVTQPTPLGSAAQFGHTKIVDLLIHAGEDINARCIDQCTPLHIAANFGHVEVIEKLVDAGADINVSARDMVTPILCAVMRGHTQIVEKLLEFGANIDVAGISEVTLLDLAVQMGHTQIVRKLVEFGARVNAIDSQVSTPLHFAAHKGHTEIVQILIDGGADVNARDRMPMSPLHFAAKEGHTEVVEALLSRGAEANAVAEFGITPLHCAAIKGHVGAVGALLTAGARWDARNNRGFTPLKMAQLAGHEKAAWVIWAAAVAPLIRKLLLAAVRSRAHVGDRSSS